MEHNPFLTLKDDTEITYSDIKNDLGYDYVTIYFETPDDSFFGFSSAKCNYPNAVIEDVIGYSEEQINYFRQVVENNGENLLNWAREDMYAECYEDIRI